MSAEEQLQQMVDQTIEMATQAMKNERCIVCFPTGLTDLDEKFSPTYLKFFLT